MRDVVWYGVRTLVLLGISLFLSYGQSFAQSDARPRFTIIQQIRGNETCCHKGTPEMRETLVSHPDIKELPLAWALRYDVLADTDESQKYRELPKGHTLGLLLEVTPDLAQASGVGYKGKPDGSDWYNGKNAFLIGYSQPQRRALLNRLFTTFHERFGFYPTFTVGWMVDAWSLKFMRDEWGVRVHELTKEQYETDSYTLVGGVFNLPYYPSLKHPLIPAGSSQEQLDLIILRQTISDIEKNYYSKRSVFTSQPNDYLSQQGGAGFDYFLALLSQVLTQESASRFGVLGLENSTEWVTYHEEYVRQLKHIAKLQKDGQIVAVSPYAVYTEYKNAANENPVRILKSAAWPKEGVLWFFGKTYRALLEVNKGEVILRDLRTFGDTADPYFEATAQVSRSYWIAPYLLDAAQMFDEKSQPNTGLADTADIPDVTRFGIRLAESQPTTSSLDTTGLKLSGNSYTMKLTPTAIELTGVGAPYLLTPVDVGVDEILRLGKTQYYLFPKHPRFLMLPQTQSKTVNLGWESRDGTPVSVAQISQTATGWVLTPVTHPQIQKLSGMLQPDRSDYPFALEKSTLFWHNLDAIAGRSPVRLFISPLNELGRVATLATFSIVLSGEDGVSVSDTNPSGKLEPFLIDFSASESAQTQVKLTLDGNIVGDKTNIRFFTDCSRKPLACLQKREELQGYLKVLGRDKSAGFTSQVQVYKKRLVSWGISVINSVSERLSKVPVLPKTN